MTGPELFVITEFDCKNWKCNPTFKTKKQWSECSVLLVSIKIVSASINNILKNKNDFSNSFLVNSQIFIWFFPVYRWRYKCFGPVFFVPSFPVRPNGFNVGLQRLLRCQRDAQRAPVLRENVQNWPGKKATLVGNCKSTMCNWNQIN